MIQVNIQQIQQAQFQYQQLLVEFINRCDVDNLMWGQIAPFLDEIKYFWLTKLEIIDLELEALTEHYTCFLLSGAIYLNVSDKEHFYFKSPAIRNVKIG